MSIESVRMTRKWRQTVKVAPQAASINENSQFTHGEHDPAIRAPTVASMQRSGIEGAGQKFWVREVAHSRRQKAHYRTPKPPTIPFFQSLSPNGADFSTMTHRLRPSSKPPTRSWARRSALDSTSLHRGYDGWLDPTNATPTSPRPHTSRPRRLWWGASARPRAALQSGAVRRRNSDPCRCIGFAARGAF